MPLWLLSCIDRLPLHDRESEPQGEIIDRFTLFSAHACQLEHTVSTTFPTAKGHISRITVDPPDLTTEYKQLPTEPPSPRFSNQSLLQVADRRSTHRESLEDSNLSWCVWCCAPLTRPPGAFVAGRLARAPNHALRRARRPAAVRFRRGAVRRLLERRRPV